MITYDPKSTGSAALNPNFLKTGLIGDTITGCAELTAQERPHENTGRAGARA